MPVLEITLLRIKNDFQAKETLATLQHVRALLAEKIHPTKSRFFSTLEDPSLVVILGSWPTIEAHHKFLDSQVKGEILGAQEGIFTFLKGLHVPLREDGEKVDNCGLPLNANVVGFEEFYIKPGERHRSAYKDIFARTRLSLEEYTKPNPAFGSWRMDCIEGEEHVIFSGWKSKGEHRKWMEREKVQNEGFKNLEGEHLMGIERWHLVDLEK
ncbi:hypothetical protein BGZ60DRAFT_418439 [Tricladium varicosporioides]|nr:hypothetical protein BGZ60DRAFT_418439 [Hymenoscyphus varicosporioides]